MTDKAKELVNIAWRGSVDLVLGTFTAYWVENVFMKMLKTQPTNFTSLLLRIFGQLTLTLITGNEARGLLVDTNVEDPTGGIVFIAAVFRQKTLWKNVNMAAKDIETWLHSIIGQYTATTLPDSNKRPPHSSSSNQGVGVNTPTITPYNS